MKVEVGDIDWEIDEGDEYDEDNECGYPDWDCPRYITLDIDVPDDASDDDIDIAIYNKLVYDIGDGWVPDYRNWYWKKVD